MSIAHTPRQQGEAEDFAEKYYERELEQDAEETKLKGTMAGSLNHIIDGDGSFTMDSIDNMGDAHEALEECFHIIRRLADGDMTKISATCKKLKYPDPFKSEYGEPEKPPMKP